MLLIRYRGVTAARVTRTSIHLLPASTVADEADRRWLLCMAFFARDVSAGSVPSPYSQARAEHFARHVLMPDAEFQRMVHMPDILVAKVFDVPHDQVEEKRLDLALAAWLQQSHSTLTVPGG